MFNPAEPLDVLDWVIDDIDLILIMSVNPALVARAHRLGPCARSEAVRKRIDAPRAKTSAWRWTAASRPTTSAVVADAGADTLVAGSAIFGKPDYKSVIDAMRVQLV